MGTGGRNGNIAGTATGAATGMTPYVRMPLSKRGDAAVWRGSAVRRQAGRAGAAARALMMFLAGTLTVAGVSILTVGIGGMVMGL